MKPFGLAWILCFLLFCSLSARAGETLTINDVARDLACPCECPLVLEDCNMTCGLTWKEEVGRLIQEGKSKQEIMDLFIAKYGEEARLTPWQKVEGKIYQYTRGFGTMDWVMLWGGILLWFSLIGAGIYRIVANRSKRQPSLQ